MINVTKFKFSIRSLLILTLLVAIVCAIIIQVKDIQIINSGPPRYCLYGIFCKLKNKDMISIEFENRSTGQPAIYLGFWDRPNTAPYCIGIEDYYNPFIQIGKPFKIYRLFK